MSSAVTIDGQTRINQLRGAEQPLVIDRMILAMIPGLDPTQVVDRTQQMPDIEHIVHTHAIDADHKGYVTPDQVVYSIILGSDVGDFSFNWIGTLEKDTDTVITVTTTPETPKRKTDLATNTTGNCITRNVMMAFQDAQTLTGITVTAETWQFDYQMTFSLHIDLDATTTQKGHVELATIEETETGTDTTRAVTPAGLKSKTDNLRFGGQLLAGGSITQAPPEVANNNYNAYVTGGVWYISSTTAANSPQTNSMGILEVLHGAMNFHFQRFYGLSNGMAFTRYSTTGGTSWTAWVAVGSNPIALHSSISAIANGQYWNITGLEPYKPAYVTSLCSVTNTMSCQSGFLFGGSWRTGYVESPPNVVVVPNSTTGQIYYSLVNGSGTLAIYQ